MPYSSGTSLKSRSAKEIVQLKKAFSYEKPECALQDIGSSPLSQKEVTMNSESHRLANETTIGLTSTQERLYTRTTAESCKPKAAFKVCPNKRLKEAEEENILS